MKGTTGLGSNGSRQQHLPKLKLRQRTRTCSSDSGVEVGSESPQDLLEDTLNAWTGRIEGVVGQEVARARELTAWARDALRQAEADEERKDEIVESWRKQMEGVMEFTSDLVDCVNNDTKDSIADALGDTVSPMETSITIEEKEEDEEKEEEIMKLFWTPCILPPPVKLSKKRRRTMSESEDIKPLAKFESDSKALKRDQKRMGKENNKGYHVHKGLKMLNSTFDAEEIFEDWNWNLEEQERVEDIFSDWLWNLQPQVDIRQRFYNDPLTEDAWNDFYFWRFNSSPSLDSIDALASDDIEATTTPENGCHAQQLMEEGRRERKLSHWLGMDCKYWECNFQNETILHSLLQDEIKEKEGTFSQIFSPKRTSPRSLRQSCTAKIEEKESAQTHQYLSFFWDESASNQATIELLMKHEEMEKQSTSIWEEKEIVFAHPPSMSSKLVIEAQGEQVEKQPTQYFPWEDPDTVAGLLEVDHHSRRPSSDSVFLWDDPAAIGMLLTDEEDEALLARKDKTDMTEELLPDWETRDGGRREWEDGSRQEWEDRQTWPREWEDRQTWPREEKTREHKHTTWEQWSLWDQFGSTGEIIKAYEEITAEKPRRSRMDWNGLEVNVDDAFWNITLSASSEDSGLDSPKKNKSSRQTRPDPINTFKAFRHIFNEVETPLHQTWWSTKSKKERKEELEEEVEDIYADWAPSVLDDERMEKKRSKRGRGPARGRHPLVGQTSQEMTNRRPGTPTLAVKKVKGWDADLGWIDSKTPKKERKSSQAWRNGRRQRQLHSKSHAKQPRTNSAFK